jgi:perosamine synthetase
MIPVYELLIGARELDLVVEAMQAGEISGSFGRFIEMFEERFAAYCDCKYGIATSSGTSALHLAMAVIGIQPGDEVLVSACTNIASGNCVVMEGGIVVPIDSEPDTWNMNTRLLAEAVSSRTRAILPVHIYGHPVDMDEVKQVAKKHNLFVVEDCAEAHGALYKGRKVGGLGDLSCFSFYANKVITTGEGGMITTNNPELAEKARLLRNLAFTQPRFRHEELGFNYRMTNVQAAIGLGQLERIEEIIEIKRTIAREYTERLTDVRGLHLPVEKDYARNVYWMYGVVIDPDFGMTRDEFATALRVCGIDTRTFFCPLNIQPVYHKRNVVRTLPCPEAEKLWERGLYLPSGLTLTDAQIKNICNTIRNLGNNG